MAQLAEILSDTGMIDGADLARAQQLSALRQVRLSATLSQLGLVADDFVARTFADHLLIPLAVPENFPEQLPAIEGLNQQWLERHAVLPIGLDDNGVTIAMADPEDQATVDGMRFATGKGVTVKVAARSDILDHLQGLSGSVSAGFEDVPGSFDLERFADEGSDAPVIRLIDRLLGIASKRKASDLHIEPMARHIAVRMRIDGSLREIERHPPALGEALASRIKVMAGLDISETRLPQDGRLRLTAGGRDLDVRVATTPSAHGEAIVMRLLGRAEVPLALDRLGLAPTALEKLYRVLERPHGIIFMTGPTGSGKTTTLYAALSHLLKPDVKILSVEDPVEILVDGINQVQVRPDIDLSYARTLRAFLRQDPDILMIGEIRDRETADIALRAALTGHLVLTTLHTNSALGAFTRLSDIGIESYLCASTCIATIAQRLVRTLCEACKQSVTPCGQWMDMFADAGLNIPAQIFEPMGCQSCNGSGYSGRAPLIEVIEIDAQLRLAIREECAEKYAIPSGDTLFGHGLALIAEGRTSCDEVARVVGLA
ncbi:MAG: ATPase, T2SS/T4P/T4SS family [Blastomonas sp.]